MHEDFQKSPGNSNVQSWMKSYHGLGGLRVGWWMRQMPMQVLIMLVPSAGTDYRYSKLIDCNYKHILEASYILMTILGMYDILLSHIIMAYSQRSPTIESGNYIQ